ncbi:MAG: hypothetical protein CBC84_002145 [Pelagibacteraceae bacterium TMED124]|nr:hypothetical protein [Candidatus Neomarinimicrobiota bacterium]RPG17350.1 MAG: hypothetical protein CBC84_002145 [Pelagibacteraceae bacterium TMED124]
MISNFFLILLFSQISFSFITNPFNGDTLNYTDVLIEWNQEQDAKAYKIKIHDRSGDLIHTSVDSSLAVVISDVFDWGAKYQISLESLYSDRSPELIDQILINTYSVPTDRDLPVQVIYIDEENYSSGYTFVDDVVIDMYGNPVLFMPAHSPTRHFIFTEQLDNGDFLGIGYGSNYGGVIVDIYGEIIYNTDPSLGNVHHDFRSMGNGNFIGLIYSNVRDTAPAGSWTTSFEQNGLYEIRWLYDEIVEFDSLGNEVWRWSTNDYFNKIDFDPNWFDPNDFLLNPSDTFDWTHCNAVFYDNQESAIYLSSRHLSRITKISYPSGDIIWMIGEDMPSGEVKFGDEMQISSQHAVNLLENGNLMLFDNGNNKTPLESRCIEFNISNDNSELSYNLIWEHVLPSASYIYRLGDCDRLPNGNTLINSGNVAAILEVNNANNIIWEPIFHSNHTSTYRAERIKGLYPLISSLTIENFKKDTLNNKLVWLPTGETSIKYTIHNEGFDAYTYTYNVSDRENLIDISGEVEIEANSSQDIFIPISVPLNMIDNQIAFMLSPNTIHPSDDNYLVVRASSCESNPGYILSDMGDCPKFPNMVGDINSDYVANVSDVILISNHIISLSDLTGDGLITADLNQVH